MALLDAPILPPLTTLAGSEAFAVVADRRNLKGITVNQLMGLSSADATASTGTSFTVSTRLTQSTNAGAVAGTLPAATGALREVIIVNTGSSLGAVTMSSTSTIVGLTTIAISTSGRFLSNGTSWYRVS